jgi:putative oxidoreductase
MARLAPLVIRLVLGVIFFAHGAQKVLGWWGGGGWSATLDAFTRQGMPAPVAMLVMLGELLGGIGLVVGCLTRVAAAGIAIIMLGAIVLVHLPNGFFINWFMTPGRGHGIEANLAYLAMAVALVLAGAGPVSVDEALFGARRVDLD